MGMVTALYALDEDRVKTLEQDEDTFFDFVDSEQDLLDLDKAWHGLHYLLTGTAWQGDAPLNFLVLGGRPLENSDGGYGPARYFTPAETASIAAALTAISRPDFEARFDPAAMTRAEIYPTVWDRPDEQNATWLGETFEELTAYLARTAAAGHGLLVVLQ